MACPDLEDAEGALVTHLDERSHAQLENHRLLVAGEVPHVLQDEVLGSEGWRR